MAEETPSHELLENLVERIDHLERILQAQTARLYAIEQRLGFEPLTRPRTLGIDDARRAESARPTPPPQTPDINTGATQTQSNAAGAGATGAGAPPFGPRARATQYQSPPPHQPQAPAKKRDIESVVGGSIFVWAGIIALVFGIGFGLKFAFDNQWIGPGVRVIIGALVGFGLLFVGEFLRSRGMRAYAFVLSGGGVLILYLSIYASYNFYQLLGQPVAFLLMALVTTAAVLLAVRLDALPIAILGLVGGFLTPILISSGQDNEVALFTYVALLDAGVLAVAYFKRWRSLDFLSFLCTVLMTLGWGLNFYTREKLWTTFIFVSVFFILYALLAVFHNVLPRRRSRWFDLALLAWNATLYFSFTFLMLDDAEYGRTALAAHALTLAAFFTALFFFARARCREDRLLAYGYVGAAVTCFTAAVAIELELYWVTVVWAVEALALTWVGLRSGEKSARRYALVVFTAAVLHWLMFDMQTSGFVQNVRFVPLLNQRALSCATLVASLFLSTWLYRRERVAAVGEDAETKLSGLSDDEREGIASVLSLTANGLAITLLSLDLSDYFGWRKSQAEGLAQERAENARQFSLTALWSIYASGLIAYGVRRHVRALRYAGFALLIAATLKVFLIDLRFYDAVWHVPVFNQTFMAFALVVAAYAFAIRLYVREPALGDERSAVPVLAVIANLLMLVALSAEASGYFDSGAVAGTDVARVHDLELAKQLSLSVIWALYGAGLLLAGGLRRVKLLRVMALVLLSITTLKVFFWDLSSLDRVYRIVSFIVLGAILLAVSYLYQKSQQRTSSEGEDATPLDADVREEAG